MNRKEKGFSLVELLIVIAVIIIVVTTGAFSYKEVMRSYRVKYGANCLYDSLIKAKAYAAYKNVDITISYTPATGALDFKDEINNLTIARVVFSKTSKDPNLRTDSNGNTIKTYYFAPYCVIRSTTRDGSNKITGLAADEDNNSTNEKILTTQNIPILGNSSIKPTILANGLIEIDNTSPKDMAAILLANQTDIDDPPIDTVVRQYFIILFRTGLIKKALLEPDGSAKVM